MYIVEAQVQLISQCCTATDPDLSCLVVTLSPSKKQVPFEPSYSTDLSHLHTFVKLKIVVTSFLEFKI